MKKLQVVFIDDELVFVPEPITLQEKLLKEIKKHEEPYPIRIEIN